MEASRPGAAASKPGAAVRSRVYYGYWIVGLALVAQFVAAGVQNYVIGAFLPRTSRRAS